MVSKAILASLNWDSLLEAARQLRWVTPMIWAMSIIMMARTTIDTMTSTNVKAGATLDWR